MENNIKRIVTHYSKKYKTNDPFELADYLKIIVQKGNLGDCSGCYMYLKKHRCIFLSYELDHNALRLVMAHELGHAILHLKENCYFMHNKTLLLTSKIERQANMFAAELLISDETIKEYFGCGYTLEQIAEEQHICKEFISLKLENLGTLNGIYIEN